MEFRTFKIIKNMDGSNVRFVAHLSLESVGAQHGRIVCVFMRHIPSILHLTMTKTMTLF
jgi:hypothetical protein